MAIRFRAEEPVASKTSVRFRPAVKTTEEYAAEEARPNFKPNIAGIEIPEVINREVVAPFKHAASLYAFDAPKAAVKAMGESAGGMGDKLLAAEFPEQESFGGKALRFGLSVPALIANSAVTALAKGAGKMAQAGGVLAGKQFGMLKPVMQATGPIAKGATEGLAAAAPYLPAQTYLDGEDAAKGTARFGAGIGAAMGAVSPLARGAGKLINKAGKTFQEMVLGKPVVQRAEEVGWAKLMSPEYSSPDISNPIKEKATTLFRNASAQTGMEVNRAVNSKAVANIKVPTFEAQANLKNVIKDAQDYEMTPAQLKGLQTFVDDFNQLGKASATMSPAARAKALDQNRLSLKQLWEYRRKLDKLAMDKNFRTKPDAMKVLNEMRSVLNEPLRSQKTIAKAFDKYAFVKRAEEEIGELTGVRQGKTVFSPETEQFINNILSGQAKGEKVALLEAVESYMPKDKRVLDDMLNYAARRRIATDESRFSIPGMATKMLGGKEGVAKAAAGAEDLAIKAKGNPSINMVLNLLDEGQMSEDEAREVLKGIINKRGEARIGAESPLDNPTAAKGKTANVSEIEAYHGTVKPFEKFDLTEAQNKTAKGSLGLHFGTKEQANKIIGGSVAGAASSSAISSTAEASEKDMTKDFEGWRSKKYLDSKGVPTIGWGFNLREPMVRRMLPKEVLSGKRELTQKEAEPVYKELRKVANKTAVDYLGNRAFEGLDEARKGVLIDMAYNLGPNKLAGFKEFKKALLNKNYNKAAKEMVNSDWYRQVGRRSKKLVEIMKGSK